MKALGERFLKEHVAVRCKPTTQAEYKRSVELFINPKIGTRKATDIERRDIAELHHDLRHIPYQANRTLGVLSKMFNLAEVWGIRPDGSNPCLHVKKFSEQKRERFLSPDEFATLGTVLREVELQHAWRRIRGKASLDDVRIHDLRHSYASNALALGEGLPMIGKLLGHTQVQTTARYAHLANDPVKAAAARVSDTIGTAMSGGRKKQPAGKAKRPSPQQGSKTA